MKNLKSLLFVSSLVLFFNACQVQDVEFRSVNDVSLGSLKADDIVVTINVKLDNPNGFKIKVVDASLDLYLDNNVAGDAHLDKKVIIKKRSEDNYDITVTTDRKQLLSAALKSAITTMLSGHVTVKVKGWIKGRVWGIGKKIFVEFKEKVDVGLFDKLKY